MTRTPLAPVVKTRVLRSRGGTVQCWGAETLDGTWAFSREESPGTPWLVIHKPTGLLVDTAGTLADCRAYAASGGAQADLELVRAHGRGEHDAERDPRCPKC